MFEVTLKKSKGVPTLGEEYISSLDIGSSLVRVFVAKINSDSTLQFIGMGKAPSRGIKKGSIINIDQAVQSIRDAINETQRMVGVEINSVYVGIAGNHILLQDSHGVVAVASEDREIRYSDIDRVLQAARVISLPPERAIIEVVPKEFIVDGLDGIKDPSGMIGVRLEVNATIVTGAKTLIHNLLRCVEKADLHIAGMVYLPLAVGEYALSDDEKRMGIVLADIGGGTTSIVVFKNGHIAASSILPIGGEYITNDIAIGLRIKTEIAEDVKIKYGIASLDHASPKGTFKVTTIGTNKEKNVTQLELAEIMVPRIEEIFHLIKEQLKNMGYKESLAGGYVLTGGVTLIPYFMEIAQKELGSPIRIFCPNYIGMKKPSFTGGIGMISYLHKRGIPFLDSYSSHSVKHRVKSSSTFEKVKNWLSEFI